MSTPPPPYRRRTDRPRVYPHTRMGREEHDILRDEEQALLTEVMAASLLLDDLALPVCERPKSQVHRTLEVLDIAHGTHRDDGTPSPDHSHPEE